MKRNDMKVTVDEVIELINSETKFHAKKLANKEAYERLVKANQTISEEKFKSTIYHQFIIANSLNNWLISNKNQL